MQSPAVKYGILGGIAVILYYLLVYSLGKELYLNTALQWGSMVIYIALMWKAVLEQKAQWNNKIDFKSALRTAFIVFLLCNLGFYFFNYGINFYDPELLGLQAEKAVAYLQTQLDNGVGDPDHANEIRQKIKAMKEHGLQNTLGPLLLSMSIGAIGGFILSAGIGFLQKTE